MSIEAKEETESEAPKVFVIREFPDDILKSVAMTWTEPVGSDAFQKLVDDLENTMMAYHALGLAGPQVGIPYRIVTILRSGKPATMINPRVTHLIGEEVKGKEGCLSFPGLFLDVKRVEKIRIEYTDRDGTVFNEELNGLEARSALHEVDHLNGKVFIDRIPKIFRSKALEEYRLLPRKARQQETQMKKFMRQMKGQYGITDDNMVDRMLAKAGTKVWKPIGGEK